MRTPRRCRNGVLHLLVAFGLLAALAPAGAVADGVATTRVTAEGFTYRDGTRSAVLHTAGWCPVGTQGLSGIACQEGGVEATATLTGGVLDFDAARRVTAAIPGGGVGVRRRLMTLTVTPQHAGVITLTVDAAASQGVRFTLVPDSATPPPARADASSVTWTAATDGSRSQTFVLAYDSDFSEAGAADDAIPAAVVVLDHGQDDVAAEHLRGDIAAPGGSVHRVTELTFAPRVSRPTGQPILTGGSFNTSFGPGRIGTRLTTAHHVRALGDALPGSFSDDEVGTEYRRTGETSLGGSFAWMRAGSDSVFTHLDEEYEEPGDPPWFRVWSDLQVRANEGRGLVDGEEGATTHHAVVRTIPSFQRGTDPRAPRNDAGRIIYDWDGQIFDEVGRVDAYGHLVAADAPSGPQSATVWLQSMWTVEHRVVGGDIDRRNEPAPPPTTDLPGFERAPDGTFHLAAPDGWSITRVVRLGGSAVRRELRPGVFHEDGSYTLHERVLGGEYWLEGETGPDGLSTWSWPMTIITEARPDGATADVAPLERMFTHVVDHGDQLVMDVSSRDGTTDRLVLGPGMHHVRTNADGTLEVLDQR